MDPEQFKHWMTGHIRDSLHYYEKQISDLRFRRRGFDPKHPLQPQERRDVGDDEKKLIDEMIKDYEDLVARLKSLLEKYES